MGEAKSARSVLLAIFYVVKIPMLYNLISRWASNGSESSSQRSEGVFEWFSGFFMVQKQRMPFVETLWYARGS